MKNLVIILLACPCLLCSCTTNAGKTVNNAEGRKRLKEQATEIANAVVAEDFETVADMTYPKCIEMMGGREHIIASQKQMRGETLASGGSIQIERVDNPGEIVESRSVFYSYVPVVARILRPMPKQVYLMKAIYIAVSLDKGNTWKFIDDAGIPMREIYKQMIPNWPSNLALPPKEVPTRIEE